MKTKIVISGFGKFHGVTNNPSTTLVNEIVSYIDNLPNKNELLFEIVNTDIIVVSGTDCKNYLNEIESKYLKPTTATPPFLLHLGVSSDDKINKLEQIGWNEADFRCADENDWWPQNEKIDSNDSHENYKTNLPILNIVDQLTNTNYQVKESDNPGRFICNYIYFLSLKLSKQYNSDSLFVHIPPFEKIGKSSQLQFLVDLMNLISISKNVQLRQ